MSRTAPELLLAPVPRGPWEALTRAATASQTEGRRARIILPAALEWPHGEIAARLQTSAPTGCKWRRRLARDGGPGFQEDARSGRPTRVGSTARPTVLAKVTHPPRPGPLEGPPQGPTGEPRPKLGAATGVSY